jgi:hypothetical protein
MIGRILFVFLCAILLTAQVPMGGGPLGQFPPGTFQSRAALDPAGGGGGSPTFTPGSSVAMQDNGFASGTKIFTGLNGGTNFPSGAIVVVAFFNRDGTPATTPLIGGQAASVVTGAQDTSNKCTLYQATMPSAQADTFSVANGSDYSGMGVAGGYFTNLASSTRDAANKVDFGSAAATITLPSTTVSATGFGLVFAASSLNATSPPTAVTWTSTTAGGGDTFVNMNGTNGATYGASITLAHTATAGAWTPGAAGVTNSWAFGACMAGATWH